MWTITFCLMTCGEKTERECLAAIKPFRDRIVFQEVRNVCPQITALNMMLDQVQTDFLVPLDADMVLNKDAFTRISAAIDFHYHDPNWHSILFKLHDTLTQADILALKVLRTSIVKQVPFKDSPTPDVEHYSTLTSMGYTCIERYLNKPPIGRHIVRGAHFCYHKYLDVYRTLRTYQREWDRAVFKGGATLLEKSKCHYDYFLYRWLTTGNQDYLWCIAGMSDGLNGEFKKTSKSLAEQPITTADKAVESYLDWYHDVLRTEEIVVLPS